MRTSCSAKFEGGGGVNQVYCGKCENVEWRVLWYCEHYIWLVIVLTFMLCILYSVFIYKRF